MLCILSFSLLFLNIDTIEFHVKNQIFWNEKRTGITTITSYFLFRKSQKMN